MSPEIQPLYPTKSLRYEICKFIFNRRLDEPSLGGPLLIKFQEMRGLLDYAVGHNKSEKMEAFAEELLSLNEEVFGDSMKRPVIKILDLKVLNKLPIAFENNLVLRVQCLSKNIGDYISELETRPQAARRYYGLVELESLPNSGVKVVLGDKEMQVTKSKINNVNLYISLVKLMYGKPGEDVLLNDYKRTDHVSFSNLVDAILEIGGIDEDNQENRLKIEKSIKDAVIYLNKKSKKKFGSFLFEEKDDGLIWIL